LEATCPCHYIWTSAVPYYDHLIGWHAIRHDQAFILSQLALIGSKVEWIVDADGDVILAAAQLPLP
jgi:hypothetical protein